MPTPRHKFSQTIQKNQQSKESGIGPTIFTIFGATGDLAQKKLFPSFFDLYLKKILPEKFLIAAFARRQYSDDSYRELVREAVLLKKHDVDQQKLSDFISNVVYIKGNFEEMQSYDNLAVRLNEQDNIFGICSNKLFYIAVPPNLYELIFTNLSKSGLTIPCKSKDEGWTRILVEKPFGKDAKTARHLDKMLGKLFEENQIFRIDHYLAKETIQNILTFRFSNALFEPIWDNKHIDRIEIKMLEHNVVGNRGSFYDGIGALRDVGQNHLVGMLTLVTMDYPTDLSSESIRKERAKILKQLSLSDRKNINKNVTRGQYENYLSEPGVATNSKTETFFSIETRIKNKRWQGVPILLTSGKALDVFKTEINIYFKDVNCGKSDLKCNRNVLTFRIQPNEGISVNFWVKKPGFAANEVYEKSMSFNYADSLDTKLVPDAYERVLYDCLHGDQTLFSSTEELEASWKFITSILENWEGNELITYKKGSNLSNLIKEK